MIYFLVSYRKSIYLVRCLYFEDLIIILKTQKLPKSIHVYFVEF